MRGYIARFKDSENPKHVYETAILLLIYKFKENMQEIENQATDLNILDIQG